MPYNRIEAAELAVFTQRDGAIAQGWIHGSSDRRKVSTRLQSKSENVRISPSGWNTSSPFTGTKNTTKYNNFLSPLLRKGPMSEVIVLQTIGRSYERHNIKTKVGATRKNWLVRHKGG
jgi:hypothetical protein